MASAPALGGEGQAHIRGVSDPNAPFTLIDRTKTTAVRDTGNEGNAYAGVCQAADLQVYEAAASMNGDARVVRLALKNRGARACRLSGYPAIELQDENGSAIASIAVRQTGASSLSGVVVAPALESTNSGTKPPVNVVLAQAGEASFEIGWSSGEHCALVSRFTVALPRGPMAAADPEFQGTFTINRALTVCKGEMLVTALGESRE